MSKPEPRNTIDELRDFLAFAVPLRSAEMAHNLRRWGHSRDQAATWLQGEAQRAGVSVGTSGDVLQFADGRPRNGRAQWRVARTAGDLASGVAAACLLAQLEGERGVIALGDYYGVADELSCREQ
ncbi:hypothetical protein [Streptomyces sp. XH2]|uniref:hypothetical protein n=1 Tax=Streptomyces sp. XH2 TaxID=3412483 RepID=UPI003C79EE58